MKKIYLTIDDSPSLYTDEMIDFLEENHIPAILFVRGAFLSDSPKSIVRAIQKGFIIGNHLYHHKRSSELSFEEITEEILRTEMMIDAAYIIAEKERPLKLLRFPHMDRGCGAEVVEYHKYPEHKETLESIFLDGLNVAYFEPSADMRATKEKLQIFLDKEGFGQPFTEVTHSFFTQTEMASARDCMFTYSTADWMLTPRHKGNWPYKKIDDLIRKIETTPYLHDKHSADILCMHDDRENILPVMKDILTHLKTQDVKFIDPRD